MPAVGVDSELVRELNRATVFDLLRSGQVTSRVELARRTGLSKATVSEIIDELIREGFVRTIGPGHSSRGRRPMLLEFAPRARLAIGVELSDSACRAVLTDLNAEPIRNVSRPVHATTFEDALDAALAATADLVADLPASVLVGIGVGAPGLVDPRRCVIQVAPALGWRDAPVGTAFANRFAVPVAVANRAKAAALGETWCGAGREVDTLVYVSVSSGVSAGIVIGRRLYRGVSLTEGELAHVTVDPEGPLCHCGNRGCLSAYATEGAILSRIRERLRLPDQRSLLRHQATGRLDLLSLNDVAAAATAGDRPTLEVLDEVAANLGVALANVVNVLNPGMVILGGSVLRALPLLLPRVETQLRRRAVSASAASLAVVPSPLGLSAVSIGAAAFLLSQVSVVGDAHVHSPPPLTG